MSHFDHWAEAEAKRLAERASASSTPKAASLYPDHLRPRLHWYDCQHHSIPHDIPLLAYGQHFDGNAFDLFAFKLTKHGWFNLAGAPINIPWHIAYFAHFNLPPVSKP